ncbi:MAG: FliA/WhiG family RNA polymerase sigma factor [Armatimonadota bacterium]|nr:FliA/WhiG family RNA polymerase sigma factor [Armatimonadota bacterium]
MPEESLWNRVRKGDEDARERAVQAYAHLVRLTVSRLVPTLPANLNQEDLIGAGYVGLIRAVDQFEPERGVKFETYAISLIRGAVLDALREEDWVPRSVREKARKVQDVFTRLEARLGRPATDDEMADALGLDMDEFHTLLYEVSRTSVVSLDDLIHGGYGSEETTLSERIRGDSPDPQVELERKAKWEALSLSLDALPERERIVIYLYYFEGLTLKEIGRELGISESRVHQLHGQAVRRLARQLVGRRDLFTLE